MAPAGDIVLRLSLTRLAEQVGSCRRGKRRACVFPPLRTTAIDVYFAVFSGLLSEDERGRRRKSV